MNANREEKEMLLDALANLVKLFPSPHELDKAGLTQDEIDKVDAALAIAESAISFCWSRL